MHEWTRETREQRQRQPTHVRHFMQTRYVCACGYATKWREAEWIATRERDRHALDGQLSLS